MNSSKISPQLAVLMALFAGISWSFLGVFVRWVDGVTPIGMAAWRTLISALFLLGVIVALGKWKDLVRSASNWWAWLLLGFSLSLHWILSISSMEATTLANAMLLANTVPLYLLVLGPIFLDEHLKPRDWVYFGLTFGGIVLLMFSRGFSLENIASGDIYALLAALTFCYYVIYVRKHHLSYPFYIMMFWLFAFAGLFMILEGLILGLPFYNGPVSVESWIYLILIGLWMTGLAHSAFNISLRGLRSDTAALITLIDVILVVFWGYLFFEEVLTLRGVVGMGMALIGLALIIRSQVPQLSLRERLLKWWRR